MPACKKQRHSLAHTRSLPHNNTQRLLIPKPLARDPTSCEVHKGHDLHEAMSNMTMVSLGHSSVDRMSSTFPWFLSIWIIILVQVRDYEEI